MAEALLFRRFGFKAKIFSRRSRIRVHFDMKHSAQMQCLQLRVVSLLLDVLQ